MPAQTTIDHIGYIDEVADNEATVRINSMSACASCHAKGACSAADQEEKVLNVSTAGKQVSSGEEVRVIIARKTGLHAVAIGYVYPFLLLMLVLITFTAAGAGELQAGIWSIASLVPYYIIVYLFKSKISQAFTFRMEKI
ncbi:MAG TPA: SoxR reducing system RseC family protein [Bacteroidales bacterium]|nr:SoxR reducing system RseC family protein [Bacteroidales bacterium]